jgi:uncharacterized protein YdcH (DUF465 family)
LITDYSQILKDEVALSKEKHKDLKKKVTVAEQQRSSKRGPKSWYDLRTLKKLKLVMKDELSKK